MITTAPLIENQKHCCNPHANLLDREKRWTNLCRLHYSPTGVPELDTKAS